MSNWHHRPRLKKLIGSQFEPHDPTDQQRLRAAMLSIDNAPHNAATSDLQTVADILGQPLSEIQAEYQRFKSLLSNCATRSQLASRFQGYMGSNQQLRFGKVVGSELNLNPIFAALLSPTGGLIGPGNSLIHRWLFAEDSFLAYHGAAHDAGGHLCTCHKIGPGYHYVSYPRRAHRVCIKNSLRGQASGILFWIKTLRAHQRGVQPRPHFAVAAAHDGFEESITSPLGITMFAPAAPEPLQSELDPATIDGIILNQAEYAFLAALLGYGIADELSDELLEEGYALLRNKGFMADEGGKTHINEELLVMMAANLYPELTIETRRDAQFERRDLRHSYIDDLIVEQSFPSTEHCRLAMVPDRNTLADRINHFLPTTNLESADESVDADFQLSGAGFSTAFTGTITVSTYRRDGRVKDQWTLQLDAEAPRELSDDLFELTPALDGTGEASRSTLIGDLVNQQVDSFGTAT